MQLNAKHRYFCISSRRWWSEGTEPYEWWHRKSWSTIAVLGSCPRNARIRQ